jgi:hypothetical protein
MLPTVLNQYPPFKASIYSVFPVYLVQYHQIVDEILINFQREMQLFFESEEVFFYGNYASSVELCSLC